MLATSIFSLLSACVLLCMTTADGTLLTSSTSSDGFTSTVSPLSDLNSTLSTISSDDCSRLVITHGTVHDGGVRIDGRRNYTAGDRLEIVCDSGYRVPHIKSTIVQVVCRTDGTWTDVLGAAQAPSCELIGGCSVPIITNGYIIDKPNGYMPDDHVTVQCNLGYVLYPLQARPLMRCKADGTWAAYDVERLSCRAANLIGCPTPRRITNGGYRMIPSDGYDASRGTWRSGVSAIYYCDVGYRTTSDDSPRITCMDGSWVGASGLPTCVARSVTDRCGPVPDVASARRYFVSDVTADQTDETEAANRQMLGTFAHNTKVVYICDAGYVQFGSATVTCNKGEWSGRGPICEQHELCRIKPPNVTHADFSVFPNHMDNGIMSDISPDGARAYYYCHTGYRLASANISTLTCNNGQWTGQLPNCVKRTNCDAPMDIEHGNWIIESFYADYRVGVEVRYECDHGFKRIGSSIIQCLVTGYWSDNPPKCLVKDEYCSEPVTIAHGFFVCKQSQCDSFRVGTELHYFCKNGYEMASVDPVVMTCLRDGVWSDSATPVCLPVEVETSGFYTTYIGQSTMKIIISTTCTILGVLLIVLFAVALQHRVRLHRMARITRLHQQALPEIAPPRIDVPAPMYMPQVHGSEHDRLALIAFADDPWGGSMASTLPTYEESMHSSLYHLSGHASLGLGRCSRIGELRPPATVGNAMRDQLPSSDQRRNSVVTNASNNLSAATAGFGSLDTVNNTSDTVSTSVTVDTYDSMASNPSLTASQRAARGSLESSSTHGSLASEAAPLLDHRGANAVGWESHRIAVAGDVCASDTLRSQTSRSLHSSDATSRIVELPEDIKDE